MYYTFALAILKPLLKSEKAAQKFKKELLELRDAISQVFPGE